MGMPSLSAILIASLSTFSGGSSCNTTNAGFALAQGASCYLEVEVLGAKWGNLGLQPTSGSWSEYQVGPGDFSGKSPYTGKLRVDVVDPV